MKALGIMARAAILAEFVRLPFPYTLNPFHPFTPCKKHTDGRRESRLTMKLYTIPKGEHCIHQDINGEMPWGWKLRKPAGMSSRQWKRSRKALKRAANREMDIMFSGVSY